MIDLVVDPTRRHSDGEARAFYCEVGVPGFHRARRTWSILTIKGFFFVPRRARWTA